MLFRSFFNWCKGNNYILNSCYLTQVFTSAPFSGLYYKLAWKARGAMRKITGYSFPQFHTYENLTLRYLKKYGSNFDLVIAEGCDMDMLFAVSNMVGKEKLCLHLHGDLQANSDCDRAFGYFIGVSDFIRKNYLSTSKMMSIKNSYVLLNGVDEKRFQKKLLNEEKKGILSSLGFSKEDFIVVFCGRIVPIKGVLELMHAILAISNPNIKLLIIGSSNFGNGNLNEYSREVQKISLQYSERIKYTGFIPNEELYKYYNIASVGVVPSLWNEPCALVTLEMMHCGLPTIATKVGGTPELFTDKTTLFIPFDSDVVNNLEKSISYLYDNIELRNKMSQEAFKRAKQFTREIYYNNFCKIVDSIVP